MGTGGPLIADSFLQPLQFVVANKLTTHEMR
jgi:hypothetical protein